MRFPRDITAEEENFRIENAGGRIGFIKRDPVEVEPVGTIMLWPMRVVGFDPDCDGSLMARWEVLSLDEIKAGLDEPDPVYAGPGGGRYAGIITNFGIYPCSGFVVTEEEVREMIRGVSAEATPCQK
jgi:hypothetical protein